MINTKIKVTKRFKLKQLFKVRGENFAKTTIFLDYLKFKKKKWKIERGIFRKHFNSNRLFNSTRNSTFFKRFNPFFFYVKFTSKFNNNYSKLSINPVIKYKSKLNMIKKLAAFFFIKTKKNLKNLLFRKKNKLTLVRSLVFSSRLDLTLFQTGLFESIKQVKYYIKNNFFLINKKLIKKKKQIILNNFDLISINFSKNIIFSKIYVYFYTFINKDKKYCSIFKSKYINNRLYSFNKPLSLMLLEKFKLYHVIRGLLPPLYPVNFKNFSFIFFNKMNKNQWNHYIDFYSILKFLKYGR